MLTIPARRRHLAGTMRNFRWLGRQQRYGMPSRRAARRHEDGLSRSLRISICSYSGTQELRLRGMMRNAEESQMQVTVGYNYVLVLEWLNTNDRRTGTELHARL